MERATYVIVLSLGLVVLVAIALAVGKTATSTPLDDKLSPDPTHDTNTVWGGRKNTMHNYHWAPYFGDGSVGLGFVAVNTEEGVETMHAVKCWRRDLGQDAKAPTYFWVPEAMIGGVLRKFSEWGKVSENQKYEMQVEKPFAGYEAYPATFNHGKVSFLTQTYISFDLLPTGCGIDYVSEANAESQSGRVRKTVGTSEQVEDVEEKIKAAKREALNLARPPDPFH